MAENNLILNRQAFVKLNCKLHHRIHRLNLS